MLSSPSFLSPRLQRSTPSNPPSQDAKSCRSALRARAGITPPSSPPRDVDTGSIVKPVASGPDIPSSHGHINLFTDLEEQAAALAARASTSKPAMTDSDLGKPIAPTKQDLHPWYSDAGTGNNDDKTTEARRCVPLLSPGTFSRACSDPHHQARPNARTHHQTARTGTPTQS